MRQAFEKFSRRPPFLACPVCRPTAGLQPLSANGPSLRCPVGHTFDINRHGFVDLRRRVAASDHYTQDFFAARRRVMAAGFYDRLIEALAHQLAAFGLDPAQGLDIGCGDGFITRQLALGAGLDISYEAVSQAARGGGPTLWICGDGARPPFLPGAFDWLLNVFAPAEYVEFAQLAPGGILLKVVPGPAHMQELRAALGLPAFVEETAQTLFAQRLELLADPVDIVQTSALDTDAARRDVALMSPVAFGRLNGPADNVPAGKQAQAAEPWRAVAAVTTHCRLLVGRLP